jgi:hypothetical protein
LQKESFGAGVTCCVCAEIAVKLNKITTNVRIVFS